MLLPKGLSQLTAWLRMEPAAQLLRAVHSGPETGNNPGRTHLGKATDTLAAIAARAKVKARGIAMVRKLSGRQAHTNEAFQGPVL